MSGSPLVIPDVSVIVPLYRSAGTIQRCVRSVVEASERAETRVQLILVFDGPDPDSFSLVDEMSLNSWVSLDVVERPHAGIAATRNAGLALATADWITLLDADDEMLDARLSAARATPTDRVIVGQQHVIDTVGEGEPGARGGVNSHHLASLLVPRAWIIMLGGLDTSVALADDWDLAIRLREAGMSIEFRDEFFVRRHIGLHNASRDTRRMAASYIEGIRRHRKRAGES